MEFSLELIAGVTGWNRAMEFALGVCAWSLCLEFAPEVVHAKNMT